MKILFRLIMVVTLFLSGPGIPALAPNTNLLNLLTSQLGVNEQQASNGINALLSLVQQHLSATDYTRLLTGAPDLATLAQKATAVASPTSPDILGTILGYFSSLLGNQGVTDLVQLTQTFAQYGLSADMVSKFFKIALDYVQGVGGANLAALLTGALKL